jgi:F-type H+-transporting ATPase subunit b
MLNKRQEEVREMIDSAERDRDEAARFMEEQKSKLDEAKKEARNIIDNSKEEAKKIKEEIETKACEKSKIILDEAQNEIRAERERSISAVRDQIVNIALDSAKKIIGKSLSEKEHKKLIEQSLKEAKEI